VARIESFSITTQNSLSVTHCYSCDEDLRSDFVVA